MMVVADDEWWLVGIVELEADFAGKRIKKILKLVHLSIITLFLFE
jgi:hypothetical protein